MVGVDSLSSAERLGKSTAISKRKRRGITDESLPAEVMRGGRSQRFLLASLIGTTIDLPCLSYFILPPFIILTTSRVYVQMTPLSVILSAET